MTVINVNLAVRGASAKNGYCIYGHPSPFAAIGFAHALCMRSGLKQTSGVLFAIHDYHDRASALPYGGAIYHMQRSSERDSQGETQLDLPRSDLDVSVIFEAEATTAAPMKQTLDDTIETMRFSGGRIERFDCRIGDASIEKALRRPGFVLTEPTIASTGTPIETLIEHITPLTGRKGWLVPSLVGFRLLEDPRPRDGSRGGHPHAYCDPLFWVLGWEWGRKIEDPQQHLWRLVRHGNVIKFTTRGDRQHGQAH